MHSFVHRVLLQAHASFVTLLTVMPHQAYTSVHKESATSSPLQRPNVHMLRCSCILSVPQHAFKAACLVSAGHCTLDVHMLLHAVMVAILNLPILLFKRDRPPVLQFQA